MTDLVGGELLIEVLYLVAVALFILSLKWLSSPATARRRKKSNKRSRFSIPTP